MRILDKWPDTEHVKRKTTLDTTGKGSPIVWANRIFLDSYSSYSVIFPADRSSVVVLCNFNSNNLPNFVMGIRSIMLQR